MRKSIFIVVLLLVLTACKFCHGEELYKISFYCNCVKCCGKAPGDPAYRITASGRQTSRGTIAVDRKIIPLGSLVEILGYGLMRAEDTGGAIKGRHIDVWVSSHKEALSLGIKKLPVKIVRYGPKKAVKKT